MPWNPMTMTTANKLPIMAMPVQQWPMVAPQMNPPNPGPGTQPSLWNYTGNNKMPVAAPQKPWNGENVSASGSMASHMISMPWGSTNPTALEQGTSQMMTTNMPWNSRAGLPSGSRKPQMSWSAKASGSVMPQVTTSTMPQSSTQGTVEMPGGPETGPSMQATQKHWSMTGNNNAGSPVSSAPMPNGPVFWSTMTPQVMTTPKPWAPLEQDVNQASSMAQSPMTWTTLTATADQGSRPNEILKMQDQWGVNSENKMVVNGRNIDNSEKPESHTYPGVTLIMKVPQIQGPQMSQEKPKKWNKAPKETPREDSRVVQQHLGVQPPRQLTQNRPSWSQSVTDDTQGSQWQNVNPSKPDTMNTIWNSGADQQMMPQAWQSQTSAWTSGSDLLTSNQQSQQQKPSQDSWEQKKQKPSQDSWEQKRPSLDGLKWQQVAMQENLVQSGNPWEQDKSMNTIPEEPIDNARQQGMSGLEWQQMPSMWSSEEHELVPDMTWKELPMMPDQEWEARDDKQMMAELKVILNVLPIFYSHTKHFMLLLVSYRYTVLIPVMLQEYDIVLFTNVGSISDRQLLHH
jgi:hypothetical protein